MRTSSPDLRDVKRGERETDHVEISIEDLFIEDYQTPLTLAALELELEEENEAANDPGPNPDEVLDHLSLVYDGDEDGEIEPLPSTRRERPAPRKVWSALENMPASVYGLVALGAVLGASAWLLVRIASARDSGLFARLRFAS